MEVSIIPIIAINNSSKTILAEQKQIIKQNIFRTNPVEKSEIF